jgi:glycopeptide antibiotics resistance protein
VPGSWGLLVYMLGLILIITLLPLRFSWPVTLRLSWELTGFDLVTNVGLFLPLGFLYRLARGGPDRSRELHRLAAGLVLSAVIEMTQLFLPGRYSSLFDVLANGLGTWLGALCYQHLRRHLRQHLLGKLALELPVMQLVYLLLGLLWLNGLAAHQDGTRLWLAPLLGLCGGIVLAAVWVQRLRPAGMLSASALSGVVGGWFLLGSLTGLATRPIFLLGWCLTITASVRLYLLLIPHPSGPGDRRFELPTLQRLWPWYITYVSLLALWPWPWTLGSWRGSLGFAELADTPGVVPVFQVLEYIAAFTLMGYMVAAYYGRRQRALRQTMLYIGLCSLLSGGLLECFRGWHTAHVASLLQLVMVVAAALYGGMVYRLQLRTVRYLLQHTTTAERVPLEVT